MTKDHGHRSDREDRAYLAAQVAGERLAAGAPEDDPITREAQHLVANEFRRLAEELRESWRSLSAPPNRARRGSRTTMHGW